MQDSLKLGFFIQPVHPPFRAYAEVLREDREAVVLADRLGYREAFIGEHLVDAAETITSSLAFRPWCRTRRSPVIPRERSRDSPCST